MDSYEKYTLGRVEGILSTSRNPRGYLKFDSRMHKISQIIVALENPGIKKIWVYGTSGIGKTSLVKQVAACAAELRLFERVITTTVVTTRQDEALEGLKRQLVSALGLGPDHRLGQGGTRESAKDKKFLVILEDVWKLEGDVDQLMREVGIPYNWKVLFTSTATSWSGQRPVGVLEEEEEAWRFYNKTVTVGVLEEEEEAWRLFDRTVGNDEKSPELDVIAKQVAARCQGLPALIVAVAAALSKRRNVPAWEDALSQLQEMKNKEMQEFINSAIELICYNYLPDLHKTLFLLCAMRMRNDDYISISDLRLEWLNSLPAMEGGPSFNSLIFDLKASHLLQKGEDSRYVTMHEVVHCAAMETARKAGDLIQFAPWFGRGENDSVGGLEEEEALILFNKIVADDTKDPGFDAIARQVVKRCKGLRVLIVTIAAALSKRPTLSAWEDALGQLQGMKNMELQEYVNSVVECICYNYLNDMHKSLFLLCGLQEHIHGDQIAISDLRAEWPQLEGMEGRPSLDSLIYDLKASYLLLQGDSSSYVKMHDLVRYAAIEIARKARDVIQCTGESSFTKASKTQEAIPYAAGGSLLDQTILSRLLDKIVPDSGMKHCTLLKELKAFNRMNDLVSLISSYPMAVATDATHEMWKTRMPLFYKLNSIRKELLQDVWKYHCRGRMENLWSKISAEFSQIKPMFENTLTYLPLHMIEDFVKAPELKTLVESTHQYGKEIMEEEPIPKLVLEFAIESAIRHITTTIQTVDWVGISGEGRHEVIQAFKIDMAEKFENVCSVSLSEDWPSSISIEGDTTDHKSSLYLIDLHDRVDVSEWTQGSRMWSILRDLKIVFITASPISCLPVDVQIRTEDHLLPWKLFCRNIVHSSIPIREEAGELVKLCGGSLTATILMARALRNASDVNVWKETLTMLSASEFNRRDILDNAVSLVSKRRRWSVVTKNCILKPLYHHWFESTYFITQWRSRGVINSDEQGLEILNDLVDAFLFEYSYSSGKQLRARHIPDLLDVIPSIFKPGQLVFRGIRGEVPASEDWDCIELDCSGTDLTELPANPSCYGLQKLLLQDNSSLAIIPPHLFESMEVLKVLNMSNTSIKTLPESFFKLTTLTELVLRGCRLFMELPPQIGNLVALENLDLGGTDIIQLPVAVQKLINLTRLIVSFYGYGELPEPIVPAGVLVKLSQLTELSIDVNPDDKRWGKNAKVVMKEVVTLKRLTSLKLYLPQVKQVDNFRKYFPSLIFLKDRGFHFIIGKHFRRIMSWTPLGVEAEFQKRGKCIRYVNGTDVPIKRLRYVLQRTKAFFLDRHHTVTKLSQFGTENMKQLEFCVLGKCSELETVIEEGPKSRRGDYGEEENDGDSSEEEEEEDSEEEEESSIFTAEPVLESLQYLIVYNMENLRSIWVSKPSIHKMSFSQLKSMRLHSCPLLSTIFSGALLSNLGMLEELIVEDCESIESLVETHPQSSNLPSKPFLPNLKKMSLHYLPKLVNISSGLHIAPQLERMSFYGCPNLKSLSDKEVSSKQLKKIRGKREWWHGLRWKEAEWKEGRPRNLANIFTPFKEDEDLVSQLAEDENTAQAS